jgi:chaperonin cofactor prefoldin
MQLSNQAVGAIMLALQKSLMEQSDIVPVLKEFNLIDSDEGVVVTNPPVISMDSVEPN